MGGKRITKNVGELCKICEIASLNFLFLLFFEITFFYSNNSGERGKEEIKQIFRLVLRIWGGWRK